MNPEPAPKPRWRPRFSLRTLMIGVLLLGFCWALTASWGVNVMRESSVIGILMKDEPFNVTAIAPFVIFVEGHFSEEKVFFKKGEDPYVRWDHHEYYVWFPGFHKQLSSNFPPISWTEPMTTKEVEELRKRYEEMDPLQRPTQESKP